MNPRAPRQARVTDQDLRQLISKVDRIIAILEAEPPRGPTTLQDETRFYPGVGVVRSTPPPGPSPAQQAAADALDARDNQ